MPGANPSFKRAANRLPMVKPRQREILNLIERGRTNQQIADHLHLTLLETKSEVSHLLGTLDLPSREDAAEFWAWQCSRRNLDPMHLLGRLPRPLAVSLSIGIAAAIVVLFVLFGRSDDAAKATPSATPDLATAAPSPTVTLSPAAKALTQYAIPLPPKGPEGRLAYIDPRGALVVKPMPSGTPVVVRSVAYQRTPRWSPSGHYLAFIEANQLVVADEQGRLTPLAEPGSDAAWAWSPAKDLLAYFSPDGMVLYDPSKPAITLIRGAGSPYPERPGGIFWSPAGTKILYGVYAGYTSPGRLDITELRTYDTVTGNDTLLLEESLPAKGGTSPLGWSGDGRWVFYREPPGFGNSAWVGSVDVHVMPATGGPSRTLGSVDGSPEHVSAPVGPDLFAYVSGGFRFATDGGRRVELVTAGSYLELQAAPPGTVSALSFSPEGLRLAVIAMPEPPPIRGSFGPTEMQAQLMGEKLWVQTIGSPATQLTDDPAYRDEHPVWSADGKSILFTRIDHAGAASLWRIPAIGGQPQLIQDNLGFGQNGVSGIYGWIEWTDLLEWSQVP